MKRALKDTVITPEDKAKRAYAIYNFAELKKELAANGARHPKPEALLI